MSRQFDFVVVGGSADGLVAATVLARGGAKVLLLEREPELGGCLREIEFAPGCRASPLAPDAGHVDEAVVRATGLVLPETVRADPPVIALGGGEPIALYRSIRQTAEALRAHSAQDADAWPAFARRVAALAGFLGELCRLTPPTVDAASPEDWLALLRLGRRYRALGREDMIELLRALPMPVADFLDDHLESPRLKGLLAAIACADLQQGPLSGGTTLQLLDRQVGADAGTFGERLRCAAGPAALINALAQAARAAGVMIESGVEAQEWVVVGERVAGLRLAGGEEIACQRLLSALDPRTSLTEMLDPAWIGPEMAATLANIRYRGVTSYLLLALDGLPEIPGIDVRSAGALWVTGTMRDIERGHDAAKYGRCSETPVVELRLPGLLQPYCVPQNRQVAVLRIQYTPYRLRDADWSAARGDVVQRALAVVERAVPGFGERVRDQLLLTPADLEARYGLREGAVSRGEPLLDQRLFMRPVPGCARYATPMPGLWLCGAGMHPGPGHTGLSGLLAARAMQG